MNCGKKLLMLVMRLQLNRCNITPVHHNLGKRKVALIMVKKFLNNEKADAVVEATIIFPMIIMIFAGLILFTIYLPTRAALQYATQHTANLLASQKSDTWQIYDENTGNLRIAGEDEIPNVYVALFSSIFSGKVKEDDVKDMVVKFENTGLHYTLGELEVECEVINFIVYEQISVTATRRIKSPINLSFVGFPDEIPITVTSTAVVRNCDELVRNMDIVAEVVDTYLGESLGAVKTFIDKFADFFK